MGSCEIYRGVESVMIGVLVLYLMVILLIIEKEHENH